MVRCRVMAVLSTFDVRRFLAMELVGEGYKKVL